MMQANIVEGFTVNDCTLKPDCKACTESKHFVNPFPNKAQRCAKKLGEFIHIDLWGKSLNASIHGNQYYISYVDDCTQHILVHFLKLKTEAVQKIEDYLTFLKNNGMKPCAIHVDGGGEFINNDLQKWCQN